MVTEFFWCPHCNVRFYQTGARGKGMQCKRGDLCPAKSAVRREEATRAACTKLTELIQNDAELIRDVICQARKVDADGDNKLDAEITSLEHKVQSLSNKISDLTELAGQGTAVDRQEIKAKVRATQTERAAVQAELARLRKAAAAERRLITPQEITEILGRFAQLLEDAAAGKLGSDVVYKAMAIFGQLTGGRIWVHVERRPGRKHTNVRGRFHPQLVRSVRAAADAPAVGDENASHEVEVWLREPPRVDAIAPEVRRLYEEERLGFRRIGKLLNVPCANIYQAYERFYEMIGEPMPPRRPRGRQRKSA